MKPTLPWALFYLASSSLLRPGEAPDVSFQHFVIDEAPPQNPWIKIVGDFNRDGRLDLVTALNGDADSDGLGLEVHTLRVSAVTTFKTPSSAGAVLHLRSQE